MAGATWYMMCNDHTLPDREVGDRVSTLNNGASQFMPQYDRGSGLLHDFDDVRATQSTAMNFAPAIHGW